MLEKSLLALYFVFVIFATYGEISLNAYENENGAKIRIYEMKQADIDSLINCNEAKEYRQEVAQKKVPWQITANAYAEQNKKAIAEGRYDAKLYDPKISAVSAKIDSAQKDYDDWLKDKTAPIVKKYDDMLEDISGKKGFGNGVTIVAILPLLAFFLPVFSSAIISKHEILGITIKLRWFFMAVAFLAQYASCQVMRSAVILKLGNEEMADWVVRSIFFGIPMGHYAATEFLKHIRLQKKVNAETGCVKHNDITPDDVMRIVPDDKWQAAAWLYKEKRAGNGHGYQAIVAKKFDVSNEAVRQWVVKYAKDHQS